MSPHRGPNGAPLLWAEIRAHFLSGLDAASEPAKVHAKAANVACLDASARWQYFDRNTRSCEEWLTKNYPSEYPLADGYRHSPSRASKGSAGATGELSRGGLERALQNALQALRKSPDDAAIYHTLGLIHVQLDDVGCAARELDQARRLDPELFEAHMSYAAVNVAFRSFKRAAAAYRRALAQRTDDYDAHLGLAGALAGQLGQSDRARPNSLNDLPEAFSMTTPSRK